MCIPLQQEKFASKMMPNKNFLLSRITLFDENTVVQ